jgi:hypothetical protein
MATTLDITSSYAGEYAGKIIAPALLSANTIANGGVEVMPNIKKSETIQKLTTDNLFADATCDFDATGSVTLTERIITPKELQINRQLCKSNFINTWEAMQMGMSAYNEMPSSFREFLLTRFAALSAVKNEQILWNGVDANAGEYDGFATLLAADADLPSANEVTGTTVTAANVITELGKIVDAVPSQMYGLEDFKLYVSQNIYKAYVRALGGFGASGLGANGFRGEGNNQKMGDLMFDGIPLFVSNGLTANQAVAAQKSNLFFGTGLMNDWNEVKLLDMSDIDGSQNVRFVQRFSAAAQYGYVEEIVTYGIVNSAN